MFVLLAKLWYVWLLFLILIILRYFQPAIKGWFGEKQMSIYLNMLPKMEYTVLNNLILKTKTATTQIDHVVISLYGIFVIEVKNYKGWIFGNEQSAQWTQTIYGYKSSFMNPIRQNYAHVKAIQLYLTAYPNLPIIPIVAFSNKSDLKINTTSHVTYFHRVTKIIKRYDEKIIEAEDIAKITGKLQQESKSGFTANKEHVQSVRNKQYEMQNLSLGSKCPKCSGTLVERNGKYGPFLACSNYPKCKFSK